MKIEIKCYSCSSYLPIRASGFVPGVDTIRFEVAACGSRGCANCSNCEDAEQLTNANLEINELRRKLVEAEAK